MAYRYLDQTVETFPYGAAMDRILSATGFVDVEHYPQTLGIATIYKADRPVSGSSGEGENGLSLSTYSLRADTISAAVAILSGEVRALFEKPDAVRTDTIFRLKVQIPDTDPLRWLRSQTDERRLFWSGRDDDFQIAGCGVADEIVENAPVDYVSLVGRLAPVTRADDPHPGAPVGSRYVGGVRFDAVRASDRTVRDPFRGCRMVLPLIEMRREGGTTEMACHVRLAAGARDRLLAALEAVREPSRSAPVLPERVGSWVYQPERDGWDEMVRQTTQAIDEKKLAKAVLSRRCRRRFSDPPDPFGLLEHLRSHSTDCFYFGFQVGPATFLAATPERLYRREGIGIMSEALAGTRPRSRDRIVDARYGEELLGSTKDVEEHRFVSDHIREVLRHLCARPNRDGAPHVALRKLTLVQHLMTSFRGELASEMTDADILAALHPTPAVAGTPTQRAQDLIRRLEDYDRGWYAGPIGWLGADGAEFAVGIRSCLIEGTELTAFAGAGIVAGSTPEGEWRETAAKLGGYQRLF